MHEAGRQFLQKPLTEWMFAGTTFKVHGQENLEVLKETPAIFPFAPHCGHTDTLLVVKGFPKELRSKIVFLSAADYWHKNPFVNFLAQSIVSVYPIPRDHYAPDSYRKIFEEDLPALLAQGKSLVFSPEGTRNRPDTGLLERRFKTGLGALVLSTSGQIPVIPIRIIGAEHLMPKERTFPNISLLLNARIDVVFGKPSYYQYSTSRKLITIDVQRQMANLKPTD